METGFVLPAKSTASSPDAVERKRRLAEAMMAQGMSTEPISHPLQGAAKIAQALIGGYGIRKADQAEADGRKAASDAFSAAISGGDFNTLAGAMGNEYMSEGQQRVLAALMQTEMQRRQPPDPMQALAIEKARLEIDAMKNPKRETVVVGNRLLDKNTGEVVFEPTPGSAGSTEYGLTPQTGVDENGNPVLIQLGKDGTSIKTPLPTGVQLSKEPIRIDSGTETILLDPITRQRIGSIPKNIAEVQKQEEVGIAQGKAIAGAPGDIVAADQALALIDDIKNDPNRTAATGMDYFRGIIPGTGAYDFAQKVEQAKSGAFLSAIEQMRGLGALSNAEGQTATKAITRLQTSLSEEGFMQALAEYEGIMRKALERAQARLGGGQQPAQAPAQPGKTYRFNPATGEIE